VTDEWTRRKARKANADRFADNELPNRVGEKRNQIRIGVAMARDAQA
jgi:hypothetical protein